MTEHEMQREVINRVNTLVRTKWPDMIMKDGRAPMFAIPNAGRRSMGAAIYMKAEGLRSGVPDLFFARPCGQYCGMFIEMKTERGKISPEQKMWLEDLAESGYCARVARSISEAVRMIEDYCEGYMP